jgi:succinoglycan biosynthesis transport protein ExoP
MERGMTADQVVNALWRRRLLVLAIAGGVFALGAAVVATLPNVYKATAVVRVEPHHPIADMVQPTISETVDRRIVTVRQELLSRTVLQRTIEELDLYAETRKKAGIDAAVEAMRRDLEVRVEGDNAFELTYSAGDPVLAAKVANRLPEIFADQAVRARQGQAARTSALFAEEEKALRAQLNEWERRIAQFKVDHMGELPEQLETNMRALDRTLGYIQARTDELRAAQVRRGDMLRAHLPGDSEVGRLRAQELEAQRLLIAARAQWTGDHPEVQRLTRELETIRARVRGADGRLVDERNERIRMTRVISEIQQQLGELEKQAAAFQARIDATPRWAHELSGLTRDYEMTRAKYDSVMSRKVEAELAQELETRGAKDIFQVISPAAVPASAGSPDRMRGLVLILLIALAAGALAGVIAESRDQSIRDVDQVKERLPMPVLAVVPEMSRRGEKRVLVPQVQNRHVSADNLS